MRIWSPARCTALEDGRNAEFLADRAQVLGRIAISHHGRAGDGLNVADVRDLGQQIVVYAVDEVLVLRDVAAILERQHGNRLARRCGGHRPGIGYLKVEVDGEGREDYGGNRRGAGDREAVPGTGEAFGLALPLPGLDGPPRGHQTLRRQLECPGEDQGDGETEQHRHDDEAHGPCRDAEIRERRLGDLDDQPADDGVGHRDPENLAALQFAQEAVSPRGRRILIRVCVHPGPDDSRTRRPDSL
jgi:hypothetical protein